MQQDDEHLRVDLQNFLFDRLRFYNLSLIPDELVRVSSVLLVKMLANYTNPQMIQVIGLGAIWAWTFDEVLDNPRSTLSEKQAFLKGYEVIQNWDLKDTKPVESKLPYTAHLLVEALNALVTNFSLTENDRSLLVEEVNLCLDGAYYETLHAGKTVSLEESLLHRSYSYATPLYGAMIFAGDYHLQDAGQKLNVTNYLKIFGRITRLRNDLSTFQKEKLGKEINIVRVLMQESNDEQKALLTAQRYYEDAYNQFHAARSTVPFKFAATIENFKNVHDAAYQIKDIRTLSHDMFF